MLKLSDGCLSATVNLQTLKVVYFDEDAGEDVVMQPELNFLIKVTPNTEMPLLIDEITITLPDEIINFLGGEPAVNIINDKVVTITAGGGGD